MTRTPGVFWPTGELLHMIGHVCKALVCKPMNMSLIVSVVGVPLPILGSILQGSSQDCRSCRLKIEQKPVVFGKFKSKPHTWATCVQIPTFPMRNAKSREKGHALKVPQAPRMYIQYIAGSAASTGSQKDTRLPPPILPEPSSQKHRAFETLGAAQELLIGNGSIAIIQPQGAANGKKCPGSSV